MRDKGFVAKHRGGILSLDNHRLLMEWAIACAGHVLYLAGEQPDERLLNAMAIAKAWAGGHTATGQAMKASVAAHAAARAAHSAVAASVARAVGHAVATAHMADHCMGSALYARRAVNLAGLSVATEANWQAQKLQHLPPELCELVTITMAGKEKSFKTG